MGDGGVEVRLVGLPIAVHERAVEHASTLRRELALVEVAAATHIGERLATLAADLRDRFGTFASHAQGDIDDAAARGRTTVDLTFAVPAAVRDAAATYGDLLEEADALCRQGELVTLTTPPELVAYRRWFLGEFIEQIGDGRAPRPWAPPPESPKEEITVATEHEPPAAPTTPVLAEGDLDLLGAPVLRDAIAARVERGEIDIVVDLSACTFVDSVGLSVLLTARERCIGLGGSFRVIGVNDDVRTLLGTVGVLDLLTE